jgi:hypothetical protein
MTYTTIKTAAETRMGGDSTGAWALADALAADLPARKGGQAETANGHDGITVSLADYAERLDADGIETPAGNAYSIDVLRQLRLVALGWPTTVRQREAAFRTHQEAGTADERKRDLLRALCIAARTEVWDVLPEDVDPDAWATAARSVRRKVESGTRYPVSANDLRLVLRRRINVPDNLPEHGDYRDALAAFAQIRRLGIYAVRIMATGEAPTGEFRKGLAGFSDTLRMLADHIDALVDGGGVTDKALDDLLTGGDR